MGIHYPIAVDSDRRIWRAFRNEYWPALYLIDAQGHIRYHQFGEGEYARSEEVIQQLLSEAGSSAVPRGLVSVDPRGAEVAADWANARSPESYVGYEHTDTFDSPGGPAARGTPIKFRVLIDGLPPAAAHGVDVDEQGYGTVTEPRMYQLIRQPSPIADREFEIEFLAPEVQVFDFTFG
jgi:hypothetical protein